MYPSVPSMVPGVVEVLSGVPSNVSVSLPPEPSSNRFASPKSRILT